VQAVEMRILTAAAIAVITSGPAAADPLSSRLQQEMLALHNRDRAEKGLAPLAWDADLAAAARSYARELDRRDDGLVHSPPRQRRGQGENLWMGTAGRFGIARMYDGWSSEKRFFRPGVFPDVARNIAWTEVGHYTQIVWPGTDRVGCGLHRGSEWDYLVCRYAPAGNVFGRPVG